MLSSTRQRLRLAILVALGILAIAIPVAYALGIGGIIPTSLGEDGMMPLRQWQQTTLSGGSERPISGNPVGLPKPQWSAPIQ